MILIQTDEGSKRSFAKSSNIFKKALAALVISAAAITGLGVNAAQAASSSTDKQSAIARIVEMLLTKKQNEDNSLSVDVRAAYIEDYFVGKGNLPAKDYAKYFVKKADKEGIDWRIAPAISMVETTGCDYTVRNHAITKRQNNCFGIGNESYDDIRDGIDHVIEMFAGTHERDGHYYAGKSFEKQILMYNSVNKSYTGKLTKVMNDIYPDSKMPALSQQLALLDN